MSELPTVFVIDDDDSVRKSLAYLLEAERFRVRTFDSAASFLKEVRVNVRGCVISDIRMPGMNGHEFQQALSDAGYTIPLILITAYGDVPGAVGAVKNGALDYLEKPVNADKLIGCVREALKQDDLERRAQAARLVFDERLQRLTPREREVFELMIQGISSRQMAGRLDLSHKTVESHRSHILRKMEVASVSELIHFALSAQSPAGSATSADKPEATGSDDNAPRRVGVFGSA